MLVDYTCVLAGAMSLFLLYTHLCFRNNEQFPSTVASLKPKAPFNFPTIFSCVKGFLLFKITAYRKQFRIPLDFLSVSPCYGMFPKMTQKIAADGDRKFNE